MLAVVAAACTEHKTLDMNWEVETPDGWIPAQVPGTLMGTLTANGIEPEALTADDYARINKTQFEKSWKYRTTFEL